MIFESCFLFKPLADLELSLSLDIVLLEFIDSQDLILLVMSDYN